MAVVRIHENTSFDSSRAAQPTPSHNMSYAGRWTNYLIYLPMFYHVGPTPASFSPKKTWALFVRSVPK